MLSGIPLSCLSWAVSIPGSVGGAIIGNAGAHGGDIASVLVSTDAVVGELPEKKKKSEQPPMPEY